MTAAHETPSATSRTGPATEGSPARQPAIGQQAEDPSARTAPRSVMSRLGSAVLGLWGAVTGVAPHVLHHVGPLAGAALLAGTGGQLLFGALAFVVSIPFLLRIRRRFHTWIAPGIALVIMAAAYTVSTLLIGPAIAGDTSPAPAPAPAVERPLDEHGH